MTDMNYLHSGNDRTAPVTGIEAMTIDGNSRRRTLPKPVHRAAMLSAL
jgi:hypothetical protein